MADKQAYFSLTLESVVRVTKYTRMAKMSENGCQYLNMSQSVTHHMFVLILSTSPETFKHLFMFKYLTPH